MPAKAGIHAFLRTSRNSAAKQKRQSKRFFFEKKPVRAAKQKTSAPAGSGTSPANAPSKQKFFGYFF
jgi:hypothetical protein